MLDIWLEIIDHLDLPDIDELSLVNKELYYICNLDYVWKRKLRQEFPNITFDNFDYKNNYRILYNLVQKYDTINQFHQYLDGVINYAIIHNEDIGEHMEIVMIDELSWFYDFINEKFTSSYYLYLIDLIIDYHGLYQGYSYIRRKIIEIILELLANHVNVSDNSIKIFNTIFQKYNSEISDEYIDFLTEIIYIKNN